jgi:hypothetical protein
MRTLIIVLVLTTLAVAAGLSFVLQAGAQEPPATLEYTCDPPHIPASTETLIRCRAVVTNTGGEVLTHLRLNFAPAASVPSPDLWYFFGGRLDGQPLKVDRGQLMYDLGTLASGEERALDLDVILRVSAPSGAVVSIFNASGKALAQELVVIEPDDVPAPVMSVDLQRNPDYPGRYSAVLTVRDPLRAVDTFTADIDLADGMSIPDKYRRLHPLLGEEIFGDKFHLDTLTLVHPVAPGEDVSTPFDIVLDDPCRGGTLAIVGYLHAPDGVVARPALVDDLPVWSSCSGAVTSLGQGGFGPPAEHLEPALTLAAMLAGVLGFATIGLAIFLVR